MNVLITGGCGFLGSNLANSFLNDGFQVTIIDNLSRQGSASNLHWLESGHYRNNKLSFHKIDIADLHALAHVFGERGTFDYVCHLAGQVAMTTSLADPLLDFRTNGLGTVNLLELVRKKAPEALLAYSSTNKVYGDLKSLRYVEKETRYTLPDYPNGIDESMPLDFASPYGCSKGCADQYVRDWFRNFGIATVVFRHSSIYGGRQFATVDQGWIGWFTRHAIMQREAKISNMNIESFTISGSGKQVRDVLHSEDLIALYKSAYLNRKNCAGEIFNIGGGFENSLSLLELFDLLSSMLRIQGGLAYSKINRRVSDQDFFVADISKAERLLGWKPRITTTDGLSRMIDWVTSFIYQ